MKMKNAENPNAARIEKRVNGFGMFKHIPAFKEEDEEHKEFWGYKGKD